MLYGIVSARPDRVTQSPSPPFQHKLSAQSPIVQNTRLAYREENCNLDNLRSIWTHAVLRPTSEGITLY